LGDRKQRWRAGNAYQEQGQEQEQQEDEDEDEEGAERSGRSARAWSAG